MSDIKTLLAELIEVRKRFREQGEAALKEAFRQVFDANPELTAFAWTQYAPYFNDGEPCEFSVHDIYYTTRDITDEEEFCRRELAHGGYWKDVDVPAAEEFVDNVLNEIPEDLMRTIFGDDSLVFVTRDGIEVEDYAHD